MFNWTKSKNPPATQQSDSTLSKKDQLIREAMGHAKTAREAIGEETLAKVRDIMQKQQQQAQAKLADPREKAKDALKSLAPHVHDNDVSPMEQAKKILLSMDSGKLAEHLRALREEDKKLH